MFLDHPSRTAINVASALVVAAHDPRLAPLLPPGAGQYSEALLLASGARSALTLNILRSRALAWALTNVKDGTLPGTVNRIALRKRFLEDETRAALAAGCSQVLVVGAGMDSLAARLAAEFPHVTFLELDHPITSRAKRHGLEQLSLLRPNLHLHPVELDKVPLKRALQESDAWSVSARSIVLAEWQLMHLPPEAAVAFLGAVPSITNHAISLVFSYEQPSGPSVEKVVALLTRMGLRAAHDAWVWSVSEKDLPAILKPHGLTLASDIKRTELGPRYLVPAGLGRLTVGTTEKMAIVSTKGPPGIF